LPKTSLNPLNPKQIFPPWSYSFGCCSEVYCNESQCDRIALWRPQVSFLPSWPHHQRLVLQHSSPQIMALHIGMWYRVKLHKGQSAAVRKAISPGPSLAVTIEWLLVTYSS
jgi:hypothetical protein